MNVEFEIILPDEGSSFRLLHTKTNPERFPWQYHYHPEYELVCVLRGGGTRHVGNHFSHYNNGDLVLMGPNLPHAGFGLDSHGVHEEIVIQIKEEVIKESIISRPEMYQIRSLLERSLYGICFTGQAKDITAKRLTKFVKLPAFEKYMELVSILQFLANSNDYILLNPDTALTSLTKKNNIRLQKILSFVERHYNEEIDVKKVAALANLSVPSFCSYFRKLMNCTFTDFINQFRIQRACLFLQSEKTISEVSFECGFNNVTYFNKVFKSIMNKTPSEYKKETAIVL